MDTVVFIVEYGSSYGDGPAVVGIYRHREDAEERAAQLGPWAAVREEPVISSPPRRYAVTLCDSQGNAVCLGHDETVEAESVEAAIEAAEYHYHCDRDREPEADGLHFEAEILED